MKIMFVGDINLGEYYTSFGHGPRSFLKQGDVFSKVESILNKADIVIGNLEAALTTKNYIPGEPESAVLRGDPKDAKILARHGFKVLQVANNHTVQHGPEAFQETVNTLQQQNIKPIGLLNQAVTILKVGSRQVGFLAASDVPDNTDINQTQYQPLNQAFVNQCKTAVAEVDDLFVLLHWGLEASTKPLPYQYELIEKLQAAGVRGVIGSHPHLFYEVWRTDNFVAAPSLGNFVFDLCWDTRLLKTGILEVELGDARLDAKLWPIKIKANGCQPTPTSDALEVRDKLTLYDLGANMKGEQLRKLAYFFSRFFKGDMRLKTKFILRKFLRPFFGNGLAHLKTSK